MAAINETSAHQICAVADVLTHNAVGDEIVCDGESVIMADVRSEQRDWNQRGEERRKDVDVGWD